MKKFSLQFFVIFLLSSSLQAKEIKSFPNVSGSVLFQVQGDRVLSTKKSGVSPNNAYIYIEPNISLNFNQNWSIKTDWRLQPNNNFTTRDSTNPERYRTFLQSNRGIKPQEVGILIEEIKIHFENEDLKFFFGKFDPTFGTAHNKSKRMGIFTAQFTEDYNLREKLGTGLSALLENSKITVNTFFNDTTGLSSSALNNRGRASTNDGVAGNTGTLSSYSVSMDGKNLFGIDNLFYNLGYRSLGVDNTTGNKKREKGYTANLEYSYKIGRNTYLIPFFEVVKINNFTGEANRNALYTTTALIGKYSSWIRSISNLTRHISQPMRSSNMNDRQLQLSIGYKFTNNLTLDITRSSLKEDSKKGSLVGINVSYLYQF